MGDERVTCCAGDVQVTCYLQRRRAGLTNGRLVIQLTGDGGNESVMYTVIGTHPLH